MNGHGLSPLKKAFDASNSYSQAHYPAGSSSLIGQLGSALAGHSNGTSPVMFPQRTGNG
jgi:hypothetical protein